jgi:glutathione S-transferase
VLMGHSVPAFTFSFQRRLLLYQAVTERIRSIFPDTNMITLHHLRNSQSFRIVWLLEELHYEAYSLKLYDRLPSYLAPDEYKAISPLGTAPVITADHDMNNGSVPLRLAESNAIIDYVLDMVEMESKESNNSDQLALAHQLRPLPGSDASRTAYLFWFHASLGSLQPILNTDTIFRLLPSKVFWPISAILRLTHKGVSDAYLNPRLTTLLQLAEAQLSQTEFLAGTTFTAADITAIFSFDTIFARQGDVMTKTYPACKAWYERMQKREAFVSALKKVGQTSIG